MSKICFFLYIVICLCTFSYNTYACNVCHSKNPKMVAMHRALEYRDCFNCHKIESKKTLEEQKNKWYQILDVFAVMPQDKGKVASLIYFGPLELNTLS